MKTMNDLTLHLSEDQIDDALIGCLEDGVASHLAACSDCAARVAEAKMPLAAFQAVSVAWSERRSATLPTAVNAGHGAVRPQRVAWGAAMAAVLALTVAVPVVRHEDEVRTAEVHRAPVQTTQAAPVLMASTGPTQSLSNEEQITQDNRLLQMIDQELDATGDSPSALGLKPVRNRTGGRGGATVQD